MQNDEPVPDPMASPIRLDLDAAELGALSRNIFASDRDEIVWWTTPHPLLGGAEPRIVAEKPDGLVRVRNLLVGLKYGNAA